MYVRRESNTHASQETSPALGTTINDTLSPEFLTVCCT